MAIAIILILLGVSASFLDSVWFPRAAIDPDRPGDEELYQTPYLTLAVDPPEGLQPADATPEIDLVLDARLIRPDKIHGTLEIRYSERTFNVNQPFRFAVEGPANMVVTPGAGCKSPSVQTNGFVKTVKFSSGICETNLSADGFVFDIPEGTYGEPEGVKTRVTPSLRIGLARDRFVVEMREYGYRGSGGTFIPENEYEPIHNYTLKFNLVKGTVEFGQLAPDPTLTEEYGRSWNVTGKLASRPDADFFSATVIHIFWNSILNWITNAAFLGFGFFLGSIELKRRRNQHTQSNGQSN